MAVGANMTSRLSQNSGIAHDSPFRLALKASAVRISAPPLSRASAGSKPQLASENCLYLACAANHDSVDTSAWGCVMLCPLNNRSKNIEKLMAAFYH